MGGGGEWEVHEKHSIGRHGIFLGAQINFYSDVGSAEKTRKAPSILQ